MVVGHIIIGIVIGIISASVSLLLGASFGWAFFVYVISGSVSIVITAGLIYVYDALTDRQKTVWWETRSNPRSILERFVTT